MFLRSLASARPRLRLRQSASWAILKDCAAVHRLRPRARDLLERLFLGDSGIETRDFAAENLEALAEGDAEFLAKSFEREAPQLGAEALASACAKAGVRPSEIDALLVCTCTGYLCPGPTSHIAERLGLRSDVFLQDLLGLGCGAALPMLEAARGVLAARPDALVATVAVEVCSAAFFVDEDPGVLVSLALFGDGAAACLWTAGAERTTGLRLHGFRTVHRPEHREKIRFVNSGGKLKNQLHREVPVLAADAVRELYDASQAAGCAVLSHTGGRDVLDAIEDRLGLPRLAESRAVLREHGNVSSPSVLLALERRLNDPTPLDSGCWLTSFGAGFAAHCCRLERVRGE